MAGQIEVAHSSQIVGAGIVAGGPFACAETEASKLVPFWPMAVAQNAQQALHKCMKPDPKVLAERAKELAGDGRSTLSPELASDNVYLFSGNEDQTVERRVVEAARHFLEEVGVPETNINLVEKQGGHAFITEQGGATCGKALCQRLQLRTGKGNPRLDLWPAPRCRPGTERPVHRVRSADLREA